MLVGLFLKKRDGLTVVLGVARDQHRAGHVAGDEVRVAPGHQAKKRQRLLGIAVLVPLHVHVGLHLTLDIAVQSAPIVGARRNDGRFSPVFAVAFLAPGAGHAVGGVAFLFRRRQPAQIDAVVQVLIDLQPEKVRHRRAKLAEERGGRGFIDTFLLRSRHPGGRVGDDRFDTGADRPGRRERADRGDGSRQ